MAQKRGGITTQQKQQAAQALAEYAQRTPEIFRENVVALFSPIKDEIDITPVYQALLPVASVLSLPCVTPQKTMVFKAWDGLHQTPDAMNIPTGTGDEVTPDVVLVPFLAFNRAGHRLGYGAGFYDKTLALLPAVRTIGLGFSWQEFTDLPVEPHDVPLNEIWTEKERIYARQDQQ